MKLTAEILNSICPSLKNKAPYIADTLNDILPKYGMDNKDIVEDFIPNLLVECMEFTQFEENLNYSAQALIDKYTAVNKITKKPRITIEDANKYGRTADHPANKQMIANCIYGGEWGKINIGNIEPTDGWDFRGSGAMQITGRGLMAEFTHYYSNKFDTTFTIYHMAASLRDKDHIEMGIHAACWFFSVAKNLIPLSLADHFNDIVKKINGGYSALNERSAYYERCKRYLV